MNQKILFFFAFFALICCVSCEKGFITIVASAEDDAVCRFCLDVIGTVRDLFNMTAKEKFQAILLEGCDLISSDEIQKMCKAAVMLTSDNIHQFLKSIHPKQICTSLTMCKVPGKEVNQEMRTSILKMMIMLQTRMSHMTKFKI